MCPGLFFLGDDFFLGVGSGFFSSPGSWVLGSDSSGEGGPSSGFFSPGFPVSWPGFPDSWTSRPQESGPSPRESPVSGGPDPQNPGKRPIPGNPGFRTTFFGNPGGLDHFFRDPGVLTESAAPEKVGVFLKTGNFRVLLLCPPLPQPISHRYTSLPCESLRYFLLTLNCDLML